jgi:type III secretory pathway component EscU
LVIKPLKTDLIQKIVECRAKAQLEENELNRRIKYFSDCLFASAGIVIGIVLLVLGLGEYVSILGIGTVDYLHSSYLYKKKI